MSDPDPSEGIDCTLIGLQREREVPKMMWNLSCVYLPSPLPGPEQCKVEQPVGILPQEQHGAQVWIHGVPASVLVDVCGRGFVDDHVRAEYTE